MQHNALQQKQKELTRWRMPVNTKMIHWLIEALLRRSGATVVQANGE